MRGDATRHQIIDAADRLFYERGFEHTSFADIAGVVQISRGNFYYHFKTKDEILDAVIQARLKQSEAMLAEWEMAGETPTERLKSFIYILVDHGDDIRAYGCPLGTLSTELAKLNHAARDGANELFTLFRTWLRHQFTLLGRLHDADDLAQHLLARSQGVATLYNAFGDDAFVAAEVKQMCDWLDNLPPAPPH